MENQASREREVFEAVSDLRTAIERESRLRELCGADRALHRRVEDLLAAEEEADTFFRPEDRPSNLAARPAPEPTEVLSETAMPPVTGSMVGRYRLLDPIGEGGFGRVYRAEQLEPIRRQVALKILKIGMDTAEVIARFQTERQTLALMDHPHVAHVLDAGATAAPLSRPFFVMELVPGLPVTDYADTHQLTIRERIALLIPVCLAVQHAHQKGIIHRDLKPSNILVTTRDDRPHPMVIDFGIAKALQTAETDDAPHTRVDQLIGTPSYMSPEQAALNGRDVDTRSDIYSLGVILYEMLTGRTPFDAARLKAAGPAGLQRVLSEEEPALPSAHFRGDWDSLRLTAAQRGSDPPRLISMLRGDLDWIVMKALEKDRNRRYETAHALARDLERYLHDEPVLAGRPTALYRVGKFVRRHRHAVAAAAGILLSLVIGLALATLGWIRAREQGALAREAGHHAEAEALYARRVAYASDMNVVQMALERSNLGLARRLLDRNVPAPGQIDLRGWEWFHLQQRCRSDAAFRFDDSEQAVTSLAVHPAGPHLFSGSVEGAVRSWDIATGELLNLLPDAGALIAINQPGTLLATSSPQNGVRIWDLPALNPVTWLPHESPMTALAFDSAGQRLGSLATSGQLVIWNVNDWNATARCQLPPSSGWHRGDFVWAQHANWILAGGSDGQVRRIASDTGSLLARWPAHEEGLTALALSPDDTTVATAAGFTDRDILLWAAADGRSAGRLQAHQAWVSALAFSPDAQTLASVGADQTLRLWELSTHRLITTLRGHLHEIWSLAFLPDGKSLVTGSKDGSIATWRIPEPLDQTEFAPLPVTQAAPTTTGSLLALDPAGHLQRIDPLNPATSTEIAWPTTPIRTLTVARHSPRIAAAAADGGVWIANLPSDTVHPAPELVTSEPSLTALRLTPDGRLLVVIADARLVSVYQFDSKRTLATWDSGEHILGSIDLSPDGEYLASGGDMLTVYRLLTGEPVAEIQSHRQPTDAVAFSPSGQFLATASQEGLARLWSVGSWTEVSVLRGHLLGVHAVAFSPDGSRLATGSVGGEAVKLWDLAVMQEVLTLTWPGVLVNRLTFSPDGHTLLAAGAYAGTRLWHAPPSSATIKGSFRPLSAPVEQR